VATSVADATLPTHALNRRTADARYAPITETVADIACAASIVQSVADARAFRMTLDRDVTSLIFTNLPTAGEYVLSLTVTQDGAGGWSMSDALDDYPFPFGVVQDVYPAAGSVSRYIFIYHGTNCVMAAQSGRDIR